ncbi:MULTISPECIES: bifunctional SulP family inorganic anion transporter/carbonic anhydrase [Legionella]|uniref:Carbonic anhydrase n=1 Tax=Legionella septentrionalis TaxID=2498109 RepID=A0A3S1CMS9_9GAMM|nr:MULTISPECIES: carbonic anhydrase family protein [Legionella]MCP0913052.1 carbonic anhydrase family protein [Legionella sp. 27cVA30]RUQ91605.1 carbonic anhydrase [Legionella septentrionalis]RUQ98529.1 carbonic anhydrase [Legionella septentrionalis]RUR10954.1 carbonic anhydrase [Legionella septentrionalis]RUR14611.1 carbonic anhydrase [Legionella septentrionalis]
MTESLLKNFRKLRVYKRRNFKFDFIAAIVVFLVAIPLCLGIALASGAPLFSGILSGIVGGIVVGSLSGSQVSVSGPAAGMAAVVLATLAQLGDFNTFLLALVLAGVLQIILGSLRAGFIGDYVPSNVIQGLLCAIGILLIIKQLPLAFTLSSTINELKANLLDMMAEGFTLKPLYELSFHINSGAILISLTGLMILVYFDKTKIKWLKQVPGAIVVVIAGIILNELFVLTDSYLAQNTPELVNLPQHNGVIDLWEEIKTPNWSAWTNPNVYLCALILAVVASLESLLNVKAGEKLDRMRRYCSKDQELVAQGFGNLVAGLIGGIPVTSVIVRTSVNVQAGAKTKFSTILHGIFILLAVLFIPYALNRIPLSSLAAILIYTGYKLTKPSIYVNIYRQGLNRFIPFITTLVAIVALNLLAGILIGLLVSLFYILKSNSQARLDIIKEIYPNGVTNRLVLPQQTTFLNKASLIAELDSIPRNSQLIIDARYSDYIDKEIVEFLKEFKEEQAPLKQISLNLIGFKDHYDIHNYVDFINVTTYDVQSMLAPHQVLNILKEGNSRFLQDTRIHRSLKIDIKHTAATQYPIAVVLGCIDSRVPVETIFDMSFGDLFCVRVAGNVVNDDVLASIEYACNVVGAKLIVVLGHTRCGAIQAACDGVEKGHITQLLAKIKPAITAEAETSQNRTGQNSHFVNNVTKLNIANTMQHIYEESKILQQMIKDEEIGIVGAIYDVNSGEVRFKDFSKAVVQLDPEHDGALADKVHKLVHAAETSSNKKLLSESA